ncbi:hypothetical protein TBLA_0D04040 [Henningerozyma blattae CBS 6284]|uniref:Palmitoyltransferase n=1 Tax=Henningerozyma blattae (strain ATCC 34711 / CBS 6284 / DSM 70876 / NBRC 10599 / NRRL Y-10934 / UCD 77-7) TaxID=1071380 RepID=I2H3E9_HENB6|nr:hypothetical protein TBLA_0D04040 [Tetrapisispora blattae CBS 6284]CCH60901.1 hypothetical protein TBLA_0D04040 [Tetrapisispora blattae CBS 6284]
MGFGTFLVVLVILQILILFISPFFKNTPFISIYYKYAYEPVVQDNKKYRWKFHIVPIFYITLFIYLVINFYAKVEPLIHDKLTYFERFFFIPISIISTPFFGIITMLINPDTALMYSNDSIKKYAYDRILYFPDTECKTCKVEKPARSKHCAVCDQCILVNDHHCVWVNNCIGRGNFLYFYLFLFDNTLFMSYASMRLLEITLNFRRAGENVPRDVMTLDILCGCFLFICGTFSYMQLLIVKDGMTTNEKDKWYTIQCLMEDKKLVKSSDNNWYISFVNDQGETEFYSTNAYDHKKYQLTEYKVIDNVEDIPNIYDKGSLWKNFKDFCE